MTIDFIWDSRVMWTSILCLAVTLGPAILILFLPKIPKWVGVVSVVIFGGMNLWIFGMSPLKLAFDGEELVVKRLFCPVRIPVGKIEYLAVLPQEELQGSIRVGASGGLYGYFGKFRNDRLGKYNMYATEWSNFFLIRTSNRTYVISCRDKRLMELVYARINSTGDTIRGEGSAPAKSFE